MLGLTRWKRVGDLAASEVKLLVAMINSPDRYNLPSFYFNKPGIGSLGSNRFCFGGHWR